MLKVWKQNGTWHAALEVTGGDVRAALQGLLGDVERAESFLHSQLDDDPCGERECGCCDVGGCDPECAQDQFAQGVEVEFNAPEDDGRLDDGQPDEAQEWHDYDPDC